MICARRTSPAPSFCERVIRASLCASSSLNPRTRSVIATSPAWTRAPCNAPDPEKSYPTCRMHHLDVKWNEKADRDPGSKGRGAGNLHCGSAVSPADFLARVLDLNPHPTLLDLLSETTA